MTYSENTCAKTRRLTRSTRTVGATLLVAVIGLSAMISAQAEAQETGTAFAHKYVPIYNDKSTMPSLMVRAPPSKP